MICWNCKYNWKPKVTKPKVCPNCGRDWRKPGLSVRLKAAWRAFWIKPQPRIKRVVTGEIIQLPEGIATDFQESYSENN